MDIPYAGVPVVDAIGLMGKFLSSLCAFIAPYNRGGIYPSDPTPPRLYCTIKAHKPEKNCPTRTILSIMGTPTYGISKYLVQIIQPKLNKSNNKIQNSTSFVHEPKDWKIEPTETQLSRDVVNLYPSVPLDRSIQVIVEFLQDDHAELKKRTKLNLTDIQQLLELSLNECFFFIKM